MSSDLYAEVNKIYSGCRSVAGPDAWHKIISALPNDANANEIISTLKMRKGGPGLPDFLPELALLEWTLHCVETCNNGFSRVTERCLVNPTLEILSLPWRGLVEFLKPGNGQPPMKPSSGQEFILIWRHPATKEIRVQVATNKALLALKLFSEGTDPREAARKHNAEIGAIDTAIDYAVKEGILISPPSQICRDRRFYSGQVIDEKFLSSPVFTLQWHLTMACDLRCKHCYDRSERTPLPLDRAIKILDELDTFCRTKHVKGQISFSGGNPFLYPSFTEVYRAASERGFAIALLGNPVGRKRVDELLTIKKPVFFQVSLEGLPEHNDMVRGSGHFKKTMDFLSTLRNLAIYSMVMLTLTKDNIDQVIPLAGMLRDKTDFFTFNRLSMVGEGAKLGLPNRDKYVAFLDSYLEAAAANPIIGLKDNLFNVSLYRKRGRMFGGCTGYGCGAAFNFLSLLPDGEVHACRKFPSKIGNIFDESLSDIYDSGRANRYREGCGECKSCPLRAVCGGCLAVAYSHHLNIFEERDPYCFIIANDINKVT